MLCASRLFSQYTCNLIRQSSNRAFNYSRVIHSAYDSDGKTTATILNQELGSNIMIDSYSTTGFRLNNGTYVYGPVAIFPKTVIGWNVKDEYDISDESLTLFTLLEPKLDILVIGYGSVALNQSKLDKDLLVVRKLYNMNIELLPTDRAIATYNFLVSECRWVAAALIPPISVQLSDADFGALKPRSKSEN